MPVPPSRGAARHSVVGLLPPGRAPRCSPCQDDRDAQSEPTRGDADDVGDREDPQQIDAMNVIFAAAAGACRHLVTGSADSSRRWSRVLLLSPEAL